MSEKLKNTAEINLTQERIETFWRMVEKTSTCWNWTGCKKPTGYGQLRCNGKARAAHRISFTIHFGPIPFGGEILHKCDNPSCVNPDHLEIGTHADNMRQMSERGRAATGDDHGMRKYPERICRGENHYAFGKPGRNLRPLYGDAHPNCKLPDCKVAEIRAKYTGKRGEQTKLAREYGVTQSMIYGIVRNRSRRGEG